MSIVGSKTKSYLGIDVGSASIKVVEFRNENRKPRLYTYGFVETVSNILHDQSEDAQSQIGELIKKICIEAGCLSTKAIAALPNFSVFSSVINLPWMPQKDLASAIRWEAKKFVPMNIDEVILDWKVLNGKEAIKTKASGSNQNIEILLTAAPRKLVQKYINIFKIARLELISLETESFALARALSEKNSQVMVLDIGAVTSDIMVIEKGVPIVNRSIDIGGATITKTIQKSLNIDEKRAEQFKRDVGVSLAFQSEGVSKIIETTFNSVINEIRYSLDLYRNRGKTVEKVVLSGGSVFLPNIPQYLEKILNIKVYIGDPWQKVVYPEELKPVLEELGPRFAIAIGLAMREIVA